MMLGSLAPPQRSESKAAKPMPKPAVAVRAVTKTYEAGKGSLAALTDVSLEIRPGELTALVGPSGSGKTTLLSIMGGILRPTHGRVGVCGYNIGGMTEVERSRVRLIHVGFVFQSYNLFPALTARQNVEVALDLKGIHGQARRAQADRLLDQMELGDKANTYPAELSGGQKQRVSIARALAGAPGVILADEPTAALDSANGRRIVKLFHDLAHAHNRAVVLVTHDSRMLDFVDRIVLIEDGRIAGDGRSSPANAVPPPATAPVILHPSVARAR